MKSLCDCCPPKIVRREFTDASGFAARFDNVPDVPGRERLARSKVSSGKIRLENKSVFAAGFRIFSVYSVGF